MGELDGKVCVVTGATSGIGLKTAEGLAGLGAHLVLVGRDPAKGAVALAALHALAPRAEISLLYADLSGLAAIRDLAAEIARMAPRIDVLVNNAGAIFDRRITTADGLERTFALNHMAYFLLTERLRANLAAAQPSRIVNVASEAHRGARLDFDDLQGARAYNGWRAYRRSKLCNILFTRELARRLAGTGVTANSLHPGFVASRFGDENKGLFRFFLSLGKQFLAISPEKGAETPVYLAASPDVAGVTGRYFSKSLAIKPSAAAQDDETARRLWRASAQIAGLPED